MRFCYATSLCTRTPITITSTTYKHRIKLVDKSFELTKGSECLEPEWKFKATDHVLKIVICYSLRPE